MCVESLAVFLQSKETLSLVMIINTTMCDIRTLFFTRKICVYVLLHTCLKIDDRSCMVKLKKYHHAMIVNQLVFPLLTDCESNIYDDDDVMMLMTPVLLKKTGM